MKEAGTTLKKPGILLISDELAAVQDRMPMSAEDRERLKTDIKRHGMRHPVIVYLKDSNYYVLAGWNRTEIARELGLDTIPVEVVEMKPAERRKFVIAENLARRHLTIAQKRALIEDRLKETPSASSRSIAAELGAHHTTVEKARDHVAKIATSRKGRDGKTYPAPKPTEKKTAPGPFDEGNYSLTPTGYVEPDNLAAALLGVIDREAAPLDDDDRRAVFKFIAEALTTRLS